MPPPGVLNQFWFTSDQQLGFQHFRYDRPIVYPARLQDEYVVVLCLRGEIEVTEADVTQTLHPGELLIGNSQQRRASCYGAQGPCEGLTLIVRRKVLEAVWTEVGCKPSTPSVLPVFPGKRNASDLRRVTEDVLDELNDERAARSHILEILGHEILARTLRLWPEEEGAPCPGGSRFLSRRHYVGALDYMQSHGKSEFCVENMCRNIGLSAGEFSKLFHRCTGRTPLQVYNGLLIEQARTALRERTGSVKEVSYELGFQSTSHFSSFFRKLTGMSPTECR